MNYVNAKPSKLAAAILSSAVTVVVTATIVFGMAGLPNQGSAPQVASASVYAGVQG